MGVEASLLVRAVRGDDDALLLFADTRPDAVAHCYLYLLFVTYVSIKIKIIKKNTFENYF